MKASHIRRPDENSRPLVEGFKAIITNATRNANTNALRVVFRKKDGTIRTMDVAFDPNLLDAFKGTRPEATAKREATNEARGNLPVRERVKNADGTIEFRWRTIPLTRVMSVSPCL